MKDRIDRLIADRAPWLFGTSPLARMSHSVLTRLLSYNQTLQLAQHLQAQSGAQIMDEMARRLARHVDLRGLDNIPRHGPALVVANHPTGIADGIILHALVAQRRPDLYFYANCDILSVLPQMADRIAPVEWRENRRSRQQTRETLRYTKTAIERGRLGIIFPSGRLAKRRGLRLYERPWMPSAAGMARKFDLPVIPIHIRARNSALFYAFDFLHPTLRDITLFHETLNKAKASFSVTIGDPISPLALARDPAQATRILRDATLALAGPDAPAPSLLKSRPARGLI